MAEIDPDVVVWRRGTGKDLVVSMHGFGSDELDLAGLAPHLPGQFSVATLRAPHVGAFGGYAWFEFDPAVDSTDHTMIDASAQAVLTWLASVRNSYARLHLLGFSQGGATAVQMARLASDRFASITHLSSFVHNGDLPGDGLLAEQRIPLFQGIGRADTVIAADKRERSIPWLDAHFEVERHYYDRDHSVSADEMEDVRAFLDRV